MPSRRAGLAVSNALSRSCALLTPLHCRQTPITASTGLSALPTRMLAAIIMPPLMRPSSTSHAPKPSTSDCCARRTNFVRAAITAALRLASACNSKNFWCTLYQRWRKCGSMPMASITCALRKLLVASVLDVMDMALASAKGLCETISLSTARPINIKVPDSANSPSKGSNMKITSR